MMELVRALTVGCIVIYTATVAATGCDDPHCHTCLDVDACEVCQSGYYVNDNRGCTHCGTGCSSCKTFGACDACHKRFYLKNNNAIYCSQCPQFCTECTSYTSCSACKTGYYGTACGSSCHDHCVGGECTKDMCVRDCNDVYYKDTDNECKACKNTCKTCSNGTSCASCDIDRYGPTCLITCKSTCPDNTCDINTGECKACPEGHFINGNRQCIPCDSTCKACISNFKQCTQCHSGYYIHGSSCTACARGCKECNDGSTCTSCKDGYYTSGQNCADCPNSCSTCTAYSVCTSCNPNYYLESKQCHSCSSTQCCPSTCAACDANNQCTTCSDGHFLASNQCHECPTKCAKCTASDQCQTCIQGHHLESNKCIPDTTCSPNCKDQQCDPQGNCINGCASSERYGPRCGKLCADEISQCSTCSNQGGTVSCNTCITGHFLQSGSCTACTSSDSDPSCDTGGSTAAVTDDGGTDSTPGIAGGVGGGVAVLVAVIVVICVIVRRRKNKKKSHTEETHIAMAENGNVTDPGNIYAKPMKVKPTEHVSTVINEPKARYIQLSDVTLQGYSNTDYDDIDIEEDVTSEQTPVPVPEQTTDTYYNMAGLVRSRVAVDKLQEHVNKKSWDDFKNEFEKLPGGLTRPYTAAMHNRANNRYQKVYPYDATRVVLKSGPTDYINANYIDCYNNYNTYIASLGPTSKTMPGFESFWTMVWQENVEVIVMVTNLTEAGAMKCEQYWPDAGTSVTYGDVTVTCHSEDVYAEYTVKSFTMQNTEKRTLHHIHYTAWPDKGVPDDVTSLIEFRQRVISCPTKLEGPTIVHCSAGVGRTGTYIALDVLTREGRDTGAVDVLGCVMSLRGQRVSMVQTAEQYEYLLHALVHSLTFDSDPIQSHKVRELLAPNNARSIQAQFEHLSQTNGVISEEEKKVIAQNKAQPHKNRQGADIPGNRHRPLLHMFQSGDSSKYINAVLVNSFKQKDQYIVTQTPLPSTVVDLLTLVVQTNCSCIVSLDDGSQQDKTVGKYLPAVNEVSEHGIFQVKCNTCDTTPQYTLRQLEVTAQGSQGQIERTVYHFQCTSWSKGDKVPKDVTAFLELTRDVEKMAAGADIEGPIIVHCLTGAERSALFCVVSILIQKMEIEHQVSVVNTVRQVKARRRTAIPNKEQYQFCHQCLADYIQSFDTYSNFSL